MPTPNLGLEYLEVGGSAVTVMNGNLDIIDAAGLTYTNEQAQDAVGAMVDSSLVYVDATPLLTRAALTGDVTASQGSNATTIPTNTVTYAKMQDVSAASKLLGRGDSGSGDPQEITLGTGLAMSGTTLNASAAFTTEDAQDAVGAMVDSTLVYVDATPLLTRAALTGDVTAPQASNSTTIANNVVTYAKMQDVSATDRLLGRDTAGSGDPEELTVGGGVEFTGSGGIQRSALTGDVTATAGSNATTIASDAVTYAKMQNVSAASKLLGRGDSGSGDPQEITLGTGLSMTGTTLASTASGSTQGKHTIWVPASAMWSAITNGVTENQTEQTTNKNNSRTLSLPKTAGKVYFHFTVAFPKAYNNGTLTYKPYWMMNSTSTNSWVSGLQAVALSDNDALDVAYGTAQEVTDAGQGSAYRNYIGAESSAMTVAGSPAAEDLIDFRGYRDGGNGSDTLTGIAVELIGIKLYYSTNADTDT